MEVSEALHTQTHMLGVDEGETAGALLFSTFTIAICCQPIVCLSVTLVRPSQAVEIFGNISTTLGTLATR